MIYEGGSWGCQWYANVPPGLGKFILRSLLFPFPSLNKILGIKSLAFFPVDMCVHMLSPFRCV